MSFNLNLKSEKITTESLCSCGTNCKCKQIQEFNTIYDDLMADFSEK